METRPGHARWALEEWTGFLIDHHQLPSLTECPPHGKDASHILHPLFFGVLQSCSHLLRRKQKLREGVILSGGHTASQ